MGTRRMDLPCGPGVLTDVVAAETGEEVGVGTSVIQVS